MAMEVKEIDIPGQQMQANNRKFPLVLSPSSSTHSIPEVTAWIREHKKEIETTLLESGVLLFRGFPLLTPSDFLEFINAFEYEHGTYLGGGGPRNIVLGPIHTSTETPPDVAIQFHHELAYLPILASYRLYNKLHEKNPSFIERLVKNKVRYTRVISSNENCDRKYQRSWQEMYDTEDRVEAEKRAHATGTDKVEWREDGSMKVVTIALDAIKLDPRTNNHVFFNSIVLLHSASHGIKAAGSSLWAPTYGDFTPIADEDVLSALGILQK